MGFGGAKQQVPSPWGEKQFKHPTRRKMTAPRANRSLSTGPVPLSGSKRTPTPSCLNSRANGIGTPCRVTGCASWPLIRHEQDFAALAYEQDFTALAYEQDFAVLA